ncbi:MAG: HD domain-containing protein [Oscillospiraceae bacterium]
MTDKLKKQLDFLIEIDKMKTIFRQTLLMDQSRQENDAEHSWHFAMMAMTLFEYANSPLVDLNHVIKMALVHDLIEIYAGDTFAYDRVGYQDKEKREKDSADQLFDLLPTEQNIEFRSLWEEFEAMETPDAIYAAAIDRLQPFLSNYKTNGHTWALHKVASNQVYQRMDVVKYALPELWNFVEDVICDSIEKGYIVEQK